MALELRTFKYLPIPSWKSRTPYSYFEILVDLNKLDEP